MCLCSRARQVATIGSLLKRTWQRTGASGASHLRCSKLRAAAYALAAVLLRTAGPCAATSLGDSLLNAALSDLGMQAPTAKAAAAAAAAATAAAAEENGGSGRKRQRGTDGAVSGGAIGGGTHGAGAGRVAPAVVRCAAVSAVHALLTVGAELLPLTSLGQLQRALLSACDPDRAAAAAPPPLPALLLTTLHASVASGRAVHSDVLPRTLAVLQRASQHAADAESRAAAHAALHATDQLVHPCGVACWSLSLEEARAAANGAHKPAAQSAASALSAMAPYAAPDAPAADRGASLFHAAAASVAASAAASAATSAAASAAVRAAAAAPPAPVLPPPSAPMAGAVPGTAPASGAESSTPPPQPPKAAAAAPHPAAVPATAPPGPAPAPTPPPSRTAPPPAPSLPAAPPPPGRVPLPGSAPTAEEEGSDSDVDIVDEGPDEADQMGD